MSDTWGKLDKDAVSALQARLGTISDIEIEDSFKDDSEGRVLYRINRRSDRALAGLLDIDIAADEEDASAMDESEASERRRAMQEEVESYETQYISLIAPEDFDYEPDVTTDDEAAARPIDEALASHSGYFDTADAATDALGGGERAVAEVGEMAGLPSIVDHRARQSSIRNQGSRGTCVSHAALALIEAQPHVADDLSEQCAHYHFNEQLGRPHNTDRGLRTTDAAGILARSNRRVCREVDWPYMSSQAQVNAAVAAGGYGPPASCASNSRFGYGAYKIITDNGLTGVSIKNTRYLEALLFQGYDVVFGTWVSWTDSNNDGILEPRLNSQGQPIGRGGHAMLLVGYNRTNQYFIVKNSWGRGWGNDGYAYLSYDLARSCFKYGYTVSSFAPAAPASGVPRRLARAPYSTGSISRSALRAAILMLRTSQNRYAIAEAYAGDNLLLRNLRVYNSDGSTHLTRSAVSVRSSYLFDVDRARETSSDADFWWRGIRPGVHQLVPRNGAAATIAYNLAGLTASRINGLSLGTRAVGSEDLDYAVVAGKTTANRAFKLLLQRASSNRLLISYLEVFDSRGRRYRYRTSIYVPSSYTYNLDTLQTSGGRYADIWWHVISNNVGFVEPINGVRQALVWSL